MYLAVTQQLQPTRDTLQPLWDDFHPIRLEWCRIPVRLFQIFRNPSVEFLRPVGVVAVGGVDACAVGCDVRWDFGEVFFWDLEDEGDSRRGRRGEAGEDSCEQECGTVFGDRVVDVSATATLEGFD